MPIEYWRKNGSQGRAGRAGDLSEGGVLLYLPERILASQDIRVKVYIGAPLESIESPGQTTWNDSHFVKKDYFHRAGVKFVGISAENMGKLKTYLSAQKNLHPVSEFPFPPRLARFIQTPQMETREGPAIANQSSPGGERQSFLLYGGEPAHPTEAREETGEDAGEKLPAELIYDFQEEYSDEQRENLYRKIAAMTVSEKFRLAVFANREARNFLIHDPNKMISLAVLKNTKMSANEIFQFAQRRHISQDVLLAIATDQKWKKNYPIKQAVVSNPKTPLSVALNLLPHLHEKDLKALSRGASVSSVLSRRADEILNKKSPK